MFEAFEEGVSLSETSFCRFCIKNMGVVFMELEKQRDQFRISMQTPVENTLRT
jgi:hypothetical protein